MEFEENIKRDLQTMGLKADRVTYTSDNFQTFMDTMEKLIKDGFAYADDTDGETMKDQRMDGIESKHRDNSVEDNLLHWGEMKEGKGKQWCIRAKIDMKAKNKCLRDPVFYRCNYETPHNRTKFQFKVYPIYDFACPLVDSIEGVTHAGRSKEYHDRNYLYNWLQKVFN